MVFFLLSGSDREQVIRKVEGVGIPILTHLMETNRSRALRQLFAAADCHLFLERPAREQEMRVKKASVT